MKTLKTLDFQLKIGNQKSNKELIDYCYNLRLKTKHITKYIENNCLKELKYKTEKITGIVITFIYGYDDKEWSNYDIPFVTHSKCIGIFIRFDKKKYDSLKTDDEFREFIYEYMTNAFDKIETKFEIPSSEILSSYNEFKEKKFIYEWLSKKKSDRARKLLAELHCTINIDRFILTLKVFQNKEIVYNNIILETNPDEYSYTHKVKNLIIEEEFIKVLGTGDKITFSLPLKGNVLKLVI